MRHVSRYIFLEFILLFFITNAFAQRHNGLTIEGLVSVEDGSPGNAVVEMYRDGQRLDDYGIGRDGHYKLELPYNYKYELIFRREDNFKQKIIVETSVPKSVLETNPKFPQFPVNINLFKEIQGIDDSFSENTVLKIYYSKKVDNFISELYYNDAQIRRLINQAVLQAGIVDKRANYMSKLTKAELAKLRKEYDKLLAQAGKEYANEEFLPALDGYKAASRVFPEEQFPKDRINEINDLLGLVMAADELEKAKIERFNKLVRDGDLHFSQKYYEASKTLYERALSIKPSDKYVEGQLTKIAEIRKLQVNNKKAFNKFIELADRAYEKQEYPEALTNYEEALKFVATDVHAGKRAAEIRKILQKQKELQLLIANADKQFELQKYTEAKTFYEKILTQEQSNKHAQDRIATINRIMSEVALDRQYEEVIKAADQLLANVQYEKARNKYKEALGLKPGKAYPQDKITEIDRKLAVIAQRNTDYQAVIAQADKFFEVKKYTDARTLYGNAGKIKPEETYPPEMIAKIDRRISEQKRLAAENEASRLAAVLIEKNKKYAEAISLADTLFVQKDYRRSRAAYHEALGIKSEENYPQERIDEIDRILKGIADKQTAQKELDLKYASLIMLAGRYFNTKDYNMAKENYQQASRLKPEKTYPKERIAEINELLKQKALNEEYRRFILIADGQFRIEKYSAAITQYQKALEVRPDEEYPRKQIQTIRNLMAKEELRKQQEAEISASLARRQENINEMSKELDEQKILKEQGINALYDEFIKKADAYFDDKQYMVSRAWYYKAFDLNPDEKYPKERIAEINRILNEMMLSKRDREYQHFIDLADENFRKNELGVARGWYNQALSHKPEAKYPKNRLVEIERLVKERLQLKSADKVKRYKAEAQKAMESGETNVAHFWYKKTLELNPSDKDAKAALNYE